MTHGEKMLAHKEDGVGTVVFNNPARHNAVSLDMWAETERILARFAQDEDVRVVVLTGAGAKAFVSGADISRFERERASVEAAERYNATVERALAAIHQFPKPTIAMIRGYCLGGGVGLAINCDLRVCGESSRFAVPAAKIGLGYAYAGVKRLVEVVGPAYAKEILFTARQFDAAEAHAMGLVNRVAPDGEVEARVREYAQMIAANAPLTVNSTKYIVGEAMKDAGERDLPRCAELVRQCLASNDYVEGRRAFMEKRPPRFTGT